MSGARGSARYGKVKVSVRVRRLDRTHRFFSSNIFVSGKWGGWKITDVVSKIHQKYKFPIEVIRIGDINRK